MSMSAGSCKAEEGVLGTSLTRPCPNPALPGEDYCPLHLVLVKRLEERHRRWYQYWEAYLERLNGEDSHGDRLDKK